MPRRRRRPGGRDARPVRPGAALPPPVAKRVRVMLMGLGTVTGIARRGIFMPYRYAAGLSADADAPGYDALTPFFAASRPGFEKVIDAIEAHAEALEAIGRAPAPAPRWAQGWFPRLDAAAAYAIVRTAAPGRIVEVGSGHSTRFYAAAVADSGLNTVITAIDPQPRATIEGLGVEILRSTVQNVAYDRLKLAPGDVLSIDSSHLLVPGSDVDILVNHVWPRLRAGVLVHFHDVFLPDGYPAAWNWRGYNEQLAIAPLIASGTAEIVFASHWALTRMGDRLAGTVLARLPLPDGAVESSLWLRKRAKAAGGAAA